MHQRQPLEARGFSQDGVASMERPFSEDVTQLTLGAGQILDGEGILAVTKALLPLGAQAGSAALDTAGATEGYR